MTDPEKIRCETPDDDLGNWEGDSNGTWIGVLILAVMIAFPLLITALYQWR